MVGAGRFAASEPVSGGGWFSDACAFDSSAIILPDFCHYPMWLHGCAVKKRRERLLAGIGTFYTFKDEARRQEFLAGAAGPVLRSPRPGVSHPG
jgi:hypothetical protein